MLERNAGSAERSARRRSPSPASFTRFSPRGIRCSSARPPTPSSRTTWRARPRVPEHRAPDRRPLFPDGDSVFLTTSHEQNVARRAARAGSGPVAEFLPNADLAFGVLGTELWSRDGLEARAARRYRRLGRRGLARVHRERARRAPDWLSGTFESERAHGLLAPWVLHTGLGPDAASSGFMAQVIARRDRARRDAGPRGGGVRLVDALAGIVRDAGGTLETGRRSSACSSPAGARRASAPPTASSGGDPRRARERDPDAALRAPAPRGRASLPQPRPRACATATAAARCRSTSRSRSRPPGAATSGWHGPRSSTSRPGSTASREPSTRQIAAAARGGNDRRGPAVDVDPSRAPEGSILWIQLQEVPSRPRGDAAGELDTGDGTLDRGAS